MRPSLENADDYLCRYPSLCAHIIAESLGYATPNTAARILQDAKEGRENWCEWVAHCYHGNARGVVEDAIRSRHHHTGFMASYKLALRIVEQQLNTGEEPLFASWF